MQPIQDYANTTSLRAHIREAVRDCLRSWEAPVYRAVDLKWAKPADLLSGRGALLNGSRWMRPGKAHVFYGASTEALALKESRRNVAYFGIRKPSRLSQKPRIIVQIDTSLPAIVDFQRLCQALPWPSLDEALAENWEEMNAHQRETLAQACGRILWDLGYAGLVAPSSRDRRGRNLIVFPQRAPDNSLRIAHRSELEKWLAH